MSEDKEKNKPKSSNQLFSRPVIFVLGAATTYVISALAPSIQKVTEPVVTGTIKQGIRLTRSTRGTASRVGASLADSYARATFELEEEERERRTGKKPPRVVKMNNREDEDNSENKNTKE